MSRTRLVMLIVIVVLAVSAFLYVNAGIYSFNAPLAKWTRNVLSKAGIELAAIETTPVAKTVKPASTPAAAPSETPAAVSSEARSADTERFSRASRQRNPDQAGFENASFTGSDFGGSGRMRGGRSGRGFGSDNGEGMDYGRSRMRIPADFNTTNIITMARQFGIDVNTPEMRAMIKQFNDANDTQRTVLMRQFASGGLFPGRGGRISGPNEPNRPIDFAAGQPQAPVDANMTLVYLNLSNTPMRTIINQIAIWTNKVIIPADESMNLTFTIYSPKQIPRKEALNLIFEAMRSKGFTAIETDKVIYIKSLSDVPTNSYISYVDPNDLEMLANKSQSVQTQFKLKYYSPSSLSSILLPMTGPSGLINADENANTLFVIDSVENLIRFKRIISLFDRPEAGYMETRVFSVQYADPAEIVQLLNVMISTTSTGATTSASSTAARGRGANVNFTGRGGRGAATTTGPAQSLIINTGSAPVTLIPEPTQKWIIAKASPEVLDQIDGWIKQFDTKERKSSGYDTISLKYVTAQEVATAVNNALSRVPGSIVQGSISVIALQQAKQLLVVGNEEMRDLVVKLVKEFDQDFAKDFITQTFKLKNADPDQIKTNIDSIYSGLTSSTSTSSLYSSSYSSSSYGSSTTGIDRVTVISIPITREVTVIASKQNIAKIEKQIEEWDAPLDPESLKPRIIELKNTDPAQMAELLNKLFSSTSSTSSTLTQYVSGSRTSAASQAAAKVVGALYGQLSFEAVPNTKKILVVSKMPDAYKVVESLIEDLDREETAEVPEVIILQYANCEDLAVRLNAMFVENGTQAPLWFTDSGLSAYSMTSGTTSSSTSTQSAMTGSGDYQPPWTRAARTTSSTTTEQVPISNVIGRIRIVPDPHSKSLLVLAPPKYREKIVEMIKVLDKPGKQVLVKAVILQVDHTTMTSLGMQVATNPLAFGTLEENAVTALESLKYLDNHGAVIFGAGNNAGQRAENTVTSSVSFLIDFLIRHVNAKVLNQQSLWTKDNEEATFFQGDNIALQTSSSVNATTGFVTSSFEYQRVGMVLRARPNITPEKNVEMIVNVILSQLAGELNGQPRRTEMETQTNMIVKDGETIMLGGILFQQESKTKRKIPLLGDIPLVGGLFQHNETQLGNSEMIVFITPFVIDNETSPETLKELDKAKVRLNDVLSDLNQSIPKAGDQPANKQ